MKKKFKVKFKCETCGHENSVWNTSVKYYDHSIVHQEGCTREVIGKLAFLTCINCDYENSWDNGYVSNPTDPAKLKEFEELVEKLGGKTND